MVQSKYIEALKRPFQLFFEVFQLIRARPREIQNNNFPKFFGVKLDASTLYQDF